NGYSRSAIGHYGLLELLQRLGDPVLRMRSRVVTSAGLLVLAEPNVADDHDVDFEAEYDRIAESIDASMETLLVLPKRVGVRDEDHTTWLLESSLLPIESVTSTIEALPMPSFPSVVRVDEVRTWHGDPELPTPTILGPVQL